MESFCPAFTGHTAHPISIKLDSSDMYIAWLHTMAAIARNRKKMVRLLQVQTTDFDQTSQQWHIMYFGDTTLCYKT